MSDIESRYHTNLLEYWLQRIIDNKRIERNWEIIFRSKRIR